MAVVPDTPATRAQAGKMAPRCRKAGIDIALVDAEGRVTDVEAPAPP
ncbi:hypothetical protein [Siccirubricoccus phaeus]|nr:hypothetical protein [Siccirubricoccus phaeus]